MEKDHRSSAMVHSSYIIFSYTIVHYFKLQKGIRQISKDVSHLKITIMYLIDSQALWAVVSFSRFVNSSSSSSVDNVTDERRDDLIAGRSLPVSFKMNNWKILSFIFTEKKFDLARLKIVRVHALPKILQSVAQGRTQDFSWEVVNRKGMT